MELVFLNKTDQQIHVIVDNLARKSVDFSTKYACFQELKRLYGLKRGQNIQKGTKGTLKASEVSVRSEERSLEKMTEQELDEALKKINEGKFANLWKSRSFDEKRETLKKERKYLKIENNIPTMTDEEIAKETGISRVTFTRAQEIQKSKTLPKILKKKAFEGESIRPIAELTKESITVQKKVAKKVEQGLSVPKAVREVREETVGPVCSTEVIESDEEEIPIVVHPEGRKSVMIIEEKLKCPHCSKDIVVTVNDRNEVKVKKR